ncbi:MAG: acyltransferase [Lysobacteraceae bacterium]|nr:MAG: acyltransferase [Xanthomonadaceae bacterium]
MEQAARANQRVIELDALRGLAALAVMLFHYTTFYDQQIGHRNPLGFGFPAGNYGVHLFFLISGFVIFMTLERTRNAMDFAMSRFSRLFPAYWVALALTATVVYTIGMPQQRLPLSDLLVNLTMIQQMLGPESLDGSYWTLEVELFFYAQMLAWFVFGQLRRIHWIIGAWLALAVIYGLAEQRQAHFSYTARELLILLHVPFFALGILFYRIYTRKDRPGELPLNLAMIALSLAAIGIAKQPIYLLVALICSAIFAIFIAGWLRWLDRPVFAFFGAISYSLYLLHQAIGFALINRLERMGLHSWGAVLVALAVALGLATLLTWTVERPAMRAIRAWWKRREAAASP